MSRGRGPDWYEAGLCPSRAGDVAAPLLNIKEMDSVPEKQCCSRFSRFAQAVLETKHLLALFRSLSFGLISAANAKVEGWLRDGETRRPWKTPGVSR